MSHTKRTRETHAVSHQRPSGLTTMSIIVLLGALFSLILVGFTIPGSRDFSFLLVDALLGMITAYGLWTLQIWARWLTAAYEVYEIVYELFLLTQPEYWNLHGLLPLTGVITSTIGLVYIMGDAAVKSAFKRT